MLVLHKKAILMVTLRVTDLSQRAPEKAAMLASPQRFQERAWRTGLMVIIIIKRTFPVLFLTISHWASTPFSHPAHSSSSRLPMKNLPTSDPFLITDSFSHQAMRWMCMTSGNLVTSLGLQLPAVWEE